MFGLFEGDKIVIDVTLRCGSIQLGPEILYTVYSWIGDHQDVCEQIAAERMGWA